MIVALSMATFVGALLWISESRWARMIPLSDRVRPYLPGRAPGRPHRDPLSAESLRKVLGPVVTELGDRISSLLGVADPLSRRLARIGEEPDVAGFRFRQCAIAGLAMVFGSSLAAIVGAPTPIVIAALIGAPVLGYLVTEAQLTQRSDRWRAELTAELPVVIEQLGMLLSTGSSLSGAIQHIGSRGTGRCAEGFVGVTRRISQGVSEIDALREWADLASVPAATRLVAVLALNREATDLGDLIAHEARASRRENHQRLVEDIERRGQKVWIPVTVATLLPGVIFMAIPFVDAMRKITGT